MKIKTEGELPGFLTLNTYDHSGCECAKMSLVPQAAFIVRKVKENEQRYKDESVLGESGRGKHFEKYNSELSPTKYSSKYMNSVWGMYNRYSVHNLKKIMDHTLAFGNHQQK